MKRTHRWGGGAVGLALLVLAVPARAQDSPLAQVPAEAPIVIQVRGLEATKDRLVAMLQTVAPDLAAAAQAKIDEALKEGIEGRQLKGLAKEGPIFLALTELPQQGQAIPKVAIIAKVTKYAEFRDGLLKEDERKNLKKEDAGYEMTTLENDQEIYFVDRKGWAIVSSNKEAAAQLAKKGPGLDKKLKKPTAEKFLTSDIALYVDMAAVNEVYGQQIQQVKGFIPLALQAAAQMGTLDKNTLEMTQAIIEGIFQTVEDSQAFLLTTEFRPEGLALHTQMRVGAETASNKFLKDQKPGSVKPIGSLPAGQIGYYVVQTSPATYKALGSLFGFAPLGANEKKALQEALNEMAAAGPEMLLVSFDVPTRGLQVAQFKDPAKAAKGQLQLYKAMEAGDNFQNVPLKGKPQIKENAESHRGFKLSSLQMTFDFAKLEENTPEQQKFGIEIMKAMLGERLNTWFGTDGKVFVSVNAPNWKSAQALLDQYLDGKTELGKQSAFQAALKQLPAETTVLTLMDVPHGVQTALPILKEKIPQLQGAKLPKDVKLKPSYMGFALTLQPELGSFDFYLPATAVAEIRKIVEPIIKGAIEGD